jgi:hypothetical protein
MGVQKKRVPWWATYWVLIPFALTGVGLLWVVLAMFVRESSTKYQVVCPNCDAMLIVEGIVSVKSTSF